jgi:hypothetical protein
VSPQPGESTPGSPVTAAPQAVKTQTHDASPTSKPHVFSGHSGDIWRDTFQPGSNPRSTDPKGNIDTAEKGSKTPLDWFMGRRDTKGG